MIDHDDIDRLNAQARARAQAKPAAAPADDIPTPQELAGVHRVDHEPQIREVIASLVKQLRAEPKLTAHARAPRLVVAEVVQRMAAKGWRCRVDEGGARDAGATDGLTVYPPCGECYGRGDVTVGPPGDDSLRPCRKCSGKGYLA